MKVAHADRFKVAPTVELPEVVDTVATFGDYMQLSRSQIEQLIDCGMPYYDIGVGKRKAYRFDRRACVRWFLTRGRR
jgi:hypothetical protein